MKQKKLSISKIIKLIIFEIINCFSYSEVRIAIRNKRRNRSQLYPMEKSYSIYIPNSIALFQFMSYKREHILSHFTN